MSEKINKYGLSDEALKLIEEQLHRAWVFGELAVHEPGNAGELARRDVNYCMEAFFVQPESLLDTYEVRVAMQNTVDVARQVGLETAYTSLIDEIKSGRKLKAVVWDTEQ